MTKQHHVCIEINRALSELAKGNNLFNGTPMEAFHSLMAAQAIGHTHYTGCDNVDYRGKCKGHLEKRKYVKKITKEK